MKLNNSVETNHHNHHHYHHHHHDQTQQKQKNNHKSLTRFLRNLNRPPKKRANDKGSTAADHDDNEQIANLLFGNHDPATCNSILNENQDDEMQITGYKRSLSRTILCWIFILLTFGLLRLVMHWWRHWLLLFTHMPCPLNTAEKVLVTEYFQGKHNVYYVKNIITLNDDVIRKYIAERKSKSKTDNLNEMYYNLIPIDIERHANNQSVQYALHLSDGVFTKINSIRLFQCKQLRYVWNEQKQSFIKLNGLDIDVPSQALHQMTGLSEYEQYTRRLVYGYNKISIPLKSIMKLLFLEVLNPFYCFQIFSVCLWFSYNYYYYATVIILMSVFGISMSVIQTRRNQLALYRTVTHSDTANVVREKGDSIMTETKYLVPGDLLEIPSSGCTMECDAVLLSGNCILDESMLTGESVPVTKTPLPNKRDIILDTKEHARHMLFCGTKVIQTRYIGSEKVLAVVINTGNKTAKGGLIRSILYPPPVDYKFEKDSYKFIMLLGSVAAIGFVYTVITKILNNMPFVKIAVESLDLITIAVPPALPAAMSVGRMYAQKRLKNNNIYCISPRSINVSGSIDCVCFDKTGTLTEDGLDMWGVVPKSSTNSFQIPINQVDRLPSDHLLYGMVTCHSLTLMSGELKGDPLDLKMFESTKWMLEEPNVSDDTKYDLLFPTIVRPGKISEAANTPSIEIGIVREFSFTSSLQRMSVITRTLSDSHFNVYCKGSPEMIVTLCRKDTVPTDFHEKLEGYAQQGYRIIGLAYKPLDKKINYAKIQRISRDKIECDLEFQGFVILENRLKEDTTSVINSLMAANIRTIMVTGDNILTALSVAKDCGMITKGQSVITVNHRQHAQDETKYELYYNLTGQPGRTAVKSDTIDSFAGTNYQLMTNSNSIDSLETIDTCTQMTNTMSINKDIDVELGVVSNDSKQVVMKNEKLGKTDYKMAEETSCNNYRFAMIGKTWGVLRDHYPELMPKFVTRGTIFARMAPDQKQSLIQELQDLGYYVAMCGDGANDCGALKAAHAGISLSEAESSVASPFTSKNPTISCVPNVIKEGRAALVTLFGIFKYMAAYSITQFSSVLILYSIESNLTDFQYLYIDLFLISVFAFFFGKTESYDGPLVRQTPLSSLVSLSPVMSLLLHLIVAISIQTIGWFHLRQQHWFVPFEYTPTDSVLGDFGCYENYTIFSISCYQYIILAFVFSKGAPYRKSIVSNYGLLISIIVSTLFTIYITVEPPTFFIDLFELVLPPVSKFRMIIVFYGIVNFIISLFIEIFIIDVLLFKKLRYRFHNIEKSRRKYLAIENDLRKNSHWPPLTAYQSDTQIIVNNDKSSPSSYAEIGIERDTNTQFDHNSIVLNSFFTETPQSPKDLPNMVESNETAHNNGKLVTSCNDSGIGFEPTLNNSINSNNNNININNNNK
jgi:cation-transporting ATPase 13A3/4/5